MLLLTFIREYPPFRGFRPDTTKGDIPLVSGC